VAVTVSAVSFDGTCAERVALTVRAAVVEGDRLGCAAGWVQVN
jgi:hypothetical protein